MLYLRRVIEPSVFISVSDTEASFFAAEEEKRRAAEGEMTCLREGRMRIIIISSKAKE